MKIQQLIIKSIGIVADQKILINKPLLIFYGEVRAGKSTILNCVRWVCGGEFPSDIISHGQEEGSIELVFDGGSIKRSFYRAKNKETKARPLVYVKDGRPVDSPATALKALLNPFMIDQDHLVRMNELDRKRYFADLFGVDTKDLDVAIFNLEREASNLRAELKGYGKIDLTEHKRVDTQALKQQRQQIVDAASAGRQTLERELKIAEDGHATVVRGWEQECRANQSRRISRTARSTDISKWNDEIKELQIKIGKLQEQVKGAATWLEQNPAAEDAPEPAPLDTHELKSKIHALHSPDTTAIDAQLSDAAAANVRAEQYEANAAREAERKGKETTLEAKETDVRAKRAEKLTRLKTINENCRVPGLAFDDAGEFTYQGTSASMLSTSQLMMLSNALSDLYPPGLAISLIDRAESLGKSVFQLVDRAKAEQKVILATVVGERPATIPEDVGVWVVENGHIKG